MDQPNEELMKIAGIIAEYNPFHNGHLHHIEETRRLSGCDFIVAAMSGSFVQRGEPAIFDKWSRAEMAVQAGADLVLELPYVFTVRSAQYFAAGGVRLLNSLGGISHLSFGAEHADLDVLTRLAEAVDEEETIRSARDHLSRGITYASGLGHALADRTGLSAEIIASPNNILAIEYLRSIRRFAPSLIPFPVERRSAAYHDPDIKGSIASATAVRKALIQGAVATAETAIPPESASLVRALLTCGEGPVEYSAFSQNILAVLRLAPLSALADLPEMNEGLHYKFKEAAITATCLEELLAAVKSKRYSRTRLQRLLIHALLQSNRSQFALFDEAGPLYARILAFNNRGRNILRHVIRNAAIPVITKTAHFLDSRTLASGNMSPLQKMLGYDILATDIHVLGRPNQHSRLGGLDFRRSPRCIPCLSSSV